MGFCRYLFVGILSLFSFYINGQIISLSPSNVGADQLVTLTFDASAGDSQLAGATEVYAHHGAVISGPDGTDWSYVIGNWGQQDGVGQMTKVAGSDDLWQITFTPNILEHFGVPNNTNVYRLSMVFRNGDGSIKGTAAPGEYGWGTVADNLDFYVDINASNFVSIDAPLENEIFVSEGESVTLAGSASAPVSDMRLFLDEGIGFMEVASVTNGQIISYDYNPVNTNVVHIKIEASIGQENLTFEKSYNIIVVKNSIIAPLPENVRFGINYDETDDQKVILALEAPGKDFVHVVGDFSNWMVQDEYQMNKTPDGEAFWIELNGLQSMQEYVFQYWVDGRIKIGDPYADKIADPWNDQWIESEVYPDLPAYDKTEFGLASVFQTGQADYPWDENESLWQRPDVNHLVIYELHLRDFIQSHNYSDLIDSLNYLKKLGINAIELMPINEFEGNDSWGYNPSYYFAPDKYYGPKNDLKKLIETCHQMDMAVILDIVLNHAFGQNPMVRMYFDQSEFRPTSQNPWFNRDYVGPFEWGFDFNHESDYTKRFIDRVNKYWLEEYHFDGYRFDFTKGFTNHAPGGDINGFDNSRINILQRMSNEIWNFDPEAYVILEHWGTSAEEQILAGMGMKMWRNKSYDVVPLTVGNQQGSFGGLSDQSHVAFFDSHDERRIAEHCLTEGLRNGAYNIRQNEIMFERVKLAAAFTFLQPGPKMMWQFDELGYDIHIDFNGRTGRKPLPWGADGLKYYEDPLRQFIYDAYRGILDVRNKVNPEKLAAATTAHKLSGYTRRLSYDTDGIDIVVIGNFGLESATIDPRFPQTGTWFNYFSTEEKDVINPFEQIELQPGEWHIFTTEKLNDVPSDAVAVFRNPVTISPMPFTKDDEITITFDATLASSDGTSGLVGAEKVYMHSGVVISHVDSTNLENIVGTFQDDGIGEMIKIEDNKWQLKIKVSDYYGLAEDALAFKIGMYFRDAENENIGKGFRNSIIYFDIDSDIPFIQISPSSFKADEEVTITFNTAKGNRELIDADKIYIHSSMGIVDTDNPASTAWSFSVGNWGQDDGVGRMSRQPNNPNLWSITLTPEDYYNLPDGEHPYWLAAVFRSADGNTKGTGMPGDIDNGFIASNLDFFIRNQISTSTDGWKDNNEAQVVFPNPATDRLYLKDIKESVTISIYNMRGRLVLESENISNFIDISNLHSGVFVVRLNDGKEVLTTKFIKG